MKLRRFLNQKGQTAVEYLLIMAVSVGMGLTFFKKFQAYMLDNPNSYMNVHMQFYRNLYDPNHGFKKYRLPR